MTHPNAPPADDVGVAPPQNLDAERSILAALLLGADTPALAPEAFYRTAHQQVYRAIIALRERGTPADLVTLSEELRKLGDLEGVGGTAYLAHLTEYAATTANLAAHARIVAETAARRELAKVAATLSQDAQEGARGIPEVLERVRAGLERAKADLAGDAPSVTYLDMSTPAPPIEWIVPGWLARREVGIIAASTGVGKSTTAADLCIAVAEGRPWLSSLQLAEGQSGPVMYLDEEQGPEEVARLFQGLRGYGQCQNLHVASMQGLGIGTDAGVAKIEAEAARIKPILIVMDTAADFFAGVDLNDLSGVTAAFSRIFRLRDSQGCTVVLLTHFRKALKDEGDLMALERMIGSVGFGNKVSTAWTCSRGDSGGLEIRQRKRRGSRLQRILVNYDQNQSSGEVTLTAEMLEASDAAKDRAEEFIVTTMRGSQTTRTGELMPAAEAAGFPKRTAERALNQLVVVGRVEHVSRGVWRLAGDNSANAVDALAEDGGTEPQVVDTQW